MVDPPQTPRGPCDCHLCGALSACKRWAALTTFMQPRRSPRRSFWSASGFPLHGRPPGSGCSWSSAFFQRCSCQSLHRLWSSRSGPAHVRQFVGRRRPGTCKLVPEVNEPIFVGPTWRETNSAYRWNPDLGLLPLRKSSRFAIRDVCARHFTPIRIMGKTSDHRSIKQYGPQFAILSSPRSQSQGTQQFQHPRLDHPR